jgi:hypothetical protein
VNPASNSISTASTTAKLRIDSVRSIGGQYSSEWVNGQMQ